MSKTVGSNAEYWVLDTCVLISSVLRPWLFELAKLGFFNPILSPKIGAELIRNAARIWRVTDGQLEALWQAMMVSFPDCFVSDIGAYEEHLKYSDPKDRHVIAAALAYRARQSDEICAGVITWNLKDFNRGEMRRATLGLHSPDELLCLCLERNDRLFFQSLSVLASVQKQFERSDEPFITMLKRERLFKLVRRLESYKGTFDITAPLTP